MFVNFQNSQYGNGLTSQMIGEEGGAQPYPDQLSTAAGGEEGGGYTTLAYGLGESGDPHGPPNTTTLALGEEGGGVTTQVVGEEGGGFGQSQQTSVAQDILTKADNNFGNKDGQLSKQELTTYANSLQSYVGLIDQIQQLFGNFFPGMFPDTSVLRQKLNTARFMEANYEKLATGADTDAQKISHQDVDAVAARDGNAANLTLDDVNNTTTPGGTEVTAPDSISTNDAYSTADAADVNHDYTLTRQEVDAKVARDRAALKELEDIRFIQAPGPEFTAEVERRRKQLQNSLFLQQNYGAIASADLRYGGDTANINPRDIYIASWRDGDPNTLSKADLTRPVIRPLQEFPPD